MPDLEKLVPNQDTEVAPKVHFSLLRVRLFSSGRVRRAGIQVCFVFLWCPTPCQNVVVVGVNPGRSVSAALTLVVE